jgi:exo-beta-1,3-glucanase (GH17 family)
MRQTSLAIALAISSVAAALLWFVLDRPVAVQPSWNEPLRSVSFAPFRRGQSPLTKTYPSPAQVDQDLQALVGVARGIRTYTSREGMDVVPDLAAKYGLKVIFGAWLGTKTETNDLEVNALITAANAHPDAIERVLVGNEVLLRRDLTPEQLIGYIRKVKAAVKQPVSYADVWAFYLKHPEVGREVDFITIHILPFWEDEPVAVDKVEEHIVRIVDKIRETFPGKPILIGEAGWPSLGRDRGPAVVSTVNEARFVRQMADIAKRHDFDYNIVEAFDQPWKSALENTVGASWGVFDIDRKAKFGMSGPVTEVADWPLRAGIAIVAGIGATVLLGRSVAGFGALLLLACLTQVLSWLTVTSIFHAQAVSFRWWQDIWLILRGGLPVLMSVAIVGRSADFLGNPASTTALPSGGRKCWLQGGGLALVSTGYALIWTVLLFVDGRYRDIPVIDFAVPAFGIAALALIRAVLARRQGWSWSQGLAFDGLFQCVLPPGWGGRLAAGLLVAAVLSLGSEGVAVIGEDFAKDHPTLAEQVPLVLEAMVSNREMILWAAMQVLMAVPYWFCRGSSGHKA